MASTSPTTAASFLPISELSSYTNRWAIKARVTTKSEVRTWNKGTNAGKVFSVDLLDAAGGEIRASFFNTAVDTYENMLQAGKVFTFSQGQTRVANRQYNNCNHRYELIFDKGAQIVAVADDTEIGTVKFNFTTMKNVQARPLPTTVDLCGIIVDFKPVQTIITKKDGAELAKRELTVADDTCYSMVVTLFGDRAKQEDSMFANQPLIALKGVSVKEWDQGRNGTLISSGSITFKPDLAEAKRVQQWWDQGGSSQSLVGLSVTGGGGGGVRGAENAKQTNIAGVKKAMENLVGQEPELFNVVGRLGFITTKKQGETQPLYYMACQEIKEGKTWACNKKVDAGGFCPSCNRAGKVAPRLNLRCRYVDFEDSCWVTTFHEAAQGVLSMTSEEAKALEEGEGGRDALEAKIQKCYFAQPLKLTIKAKIDTYNGESRPNITIAAACPVSRSEHGRQLLKEVHDLIAAGA